MIEHDFALAIHAYYVGEFAAGRRACERLLAAANLPDDLEPMVRHNRLWYTQPLSELADARYLRLDVEPARDGWSTFNPTILSTAAGMLAIVRSSNYRIIDGRYEMPPDDKTIRTENILVRLSPDLVVREARVLACEPYPRIDYPVAGLEDCRLRHTKKGIGISATIRDAAPHADGRCRMATAELDAESAILSGLVVLEGLQVQEHEKNWMPIVGRNAWLHSCHLAGSVVTVDEDGEVWAVHKRGPSPPVARGWRGGGQVVPFRGGYLAVVHEVAPNGNQRAYEHRLALLDNSLAVKSYSPPFYFREPKAIEFAAGLAIVDGRVIVSFGVRDAEAWLVEMPEADAWRLVNQFS